MRCDSCAQCDLCTGLSPEDGDNGLNVMASRLCNWVLYKRVAATGYSWRGSRVASSMVCLRLDFTFASRGFSGGCAQEGNSLTFEDCIELDNLMDLN